MNKTLSLITLGLTLVGCASTSIDNQVDFQTNPSYKQTLPRAQIMPTTEQLRGKATRVIILPTESENGLALKSKSTSTLSNTLDNILQKAGLDVIDRSMSAKVKDELIAYESTGQYNQDFINVADIAISSTIASAAFSHVFTEGHKSKNIFSGKEEWVKPSCSYKAKVSGTAKSYNLPNIKLNNQVALNGVATISGDARGSSCRLSTIETYGLVNEAAASAVRNYRTVIQNQFAPKAYVTEYRIMNNKHYIQISLGSRMRVTQGNDIQFVRQVAITNDLTGLTTHDEFPIGTGEVTDIIQENTSWVAVDEKTAKQLHLGDIAVISFSESFLDKMKSVTQSLQSI